MPAANEEWIGELGRQLRLRTDPWMVLDGPEAVEAALAGWWDVRGILAAEGAEWSPPLWSGLEVTFIGPGQWRELACGDSLEAVVGLALLPDERADVTGLLGEMPADGVVVVCPRLADAAHAGAVVRHAAAMGAAAVLFGDGGASPYEREAVRASAGALFRIPVRVADGGQILRCLKAMRFHLVGSADEATAVRNLNGVGYEDRRRALVIGGGDGGLDAFWRMACDDLVRIPLAAAADSLDPAARAVVMLWQMMQRR